MWKVPEERRTEKDEWRNKRETERKRGNTRVFETNEARVSRIGVSLDWPDRRRRSTTSKHVRLEGIRVPIVFASSFASSSTLKGPTRFYFILLCESPPLHALPSSRWRERTRQETNYDQRETKENKATKILLSFPFFLLKLNDFNDSSDNRLAGVDSSDFWMFW